MANDGSIKKVVVAYSGGLDTSIILSWIKENYKAEVIAVCVDVGQGKELKGLNEKAKKTGASKSYIIDAKKEFVTDYIYPAIKADALYENKYYLGTALARPVIAEKIAEIVIKEKADAVCHGATGKGNDQVRFELAFKALIPNVKIIAPWREWNLRSREDAINYAKKRGIPVPVTKAKPYSSDANLWHVSYEGGVMEDMKNEYDESMFKMTVSAQKAPNKPEYLSIAFEKGAPVAVNGKKLAPVELVSKLNEIAGRNGIGRVDMIENRLVGMKSRGVYESPAATVLYCAHQELEELALDRDTLHYKQELAHKWAELAYYGLWFSPLMDALNSFVESTQKYVTGTIKLKLYKGNITPVSREAKYSLYWEELATFEKDEVYNQKDAEGFINLWGLPTKVIAIKRNKK
ncbi:argininosuccinate synthase [Endomicrobium proavitum]|uniref:Argininosuccinate synthase n=1 Tax=Endomicrobium proavitum TaxID=1408281 RepID=A0A0G3WJU9_9BACT|nr:argininosuccinate synthase [Endomicrobium proavitum]AKL98147.1 Argininosuccinate synthase [Endomicrobium proavitum]